MLRLIRRYTFSAGHRLSRAQWDPEQNRRVYGRCANPHGHGHNYTLWVAVSGEMDPASGMIADLAELDRVVRRQVVDRLDHRFIKDPAEVVSVGTSRWAAMRASSALAGSSLGSCGTSPPRKAFARVIGARR